MGQPSQSTALRPGTWGGPRSITEHCAAVRDALAVRTPGGEDLRLAHAGGRSLAAAQTAPLPLPPFDNSQMDGFAVASDGTPGRFAVRETIPAGRVPPPLEPGTAAPIMTGAPIPARADAVVPVEDTPAGTFDVTAVDLPAVPAGRFVRTAGSDVRPGEEVLPAGTRLGPAALGLLAALGRTSVTVIARPRVLVCTGGDEVVPPGEPLSPGRIHDANTDLLSSQLAALGAEVCATRLVDDSPGAFLCGLRGDIAAHDPDLVVTSGGISAGRFEVVRLALAAEPEVRFGGVAMQPGGPQGLGVLGGTTPILCLPGNPVSTWVSAVLLLQPALAAVWGTVPLRERRARLSEETARLPTKSQVRRAVHRDGDSGAIDLLPGTSSHLLAEAARAQVLALVPPGERPLPAGSEIDVVDL